MSQPLVASNTKADDSEWGWPLSGIIHAIWGSKDDGTAHSAVAPRVEWGGTDPEQPFAPLGPDDTAAGGGGGDGEGTNALYTQAELQTAQERIDGKHGDNNAWIARVLTAAGTEMCAINMPESEIPVGLSAQLHTCFKEFDIARKGNSRVAAAARAGREIDLQTLENNALVLTLSAMRLRGAIMNLRKNRLERIIAEAEGISEPMPPALLLRLVPDDI